MASTIYRLLRRLGVRGALLGLAIMVIVPTLIGSVQSVQREHRQVQRIRQAAQWNEALQPLRDITKVMALHRGLTSRILNGDDSARAPRQEARSEINALFASATTLIPAQAKASAAIERFRSRWQEIERMVDTGLQPPRSLFGAHTQLIARIQSTVRSEQTRDGSSLPSSVLLLGGLQMDIAQAAEYTGQIRGLGAGYVASEGADPSVPGDLRVLNELVAALATGIAEHPQLAQGGALTRDVESAVQRLQRYIQHAGDATGDPSLTTAGAYFDQGTQVIKDLSKANDVVRSTLLGELASAAEAADASVTRSVSLGVVLAVLVLMALLAFGSYLFAELGAEPKVVREMTERIARGDLRADDAIVARHGIVVAVDHMREQLHNTLTKVSRDAESLARASSEVAQAAQTIAQGAEQQASRVEQSRSVLASVDASIRTNSGSAERTDDIARETSRDAAEGEATVREAVRTMHTISHSIAVVKEIASRTNTLSLNAAIEASRAGRYGKGFAVVAHEIGRLADRSQAAAKQVNELAQNSVKTAENVQGVFASIAPKVAETADRVSQIRSGSERQSESTQEVASAMTELLSVARSNATQAHRLSATSDSLLARSSSLSHRVEEFRLA